MSVMCILELLLAVDFRLVSTEVIDDFGQNDGKTCLDGVISKRPGECPALRVNIKSISSFEDGNYAIYMFTWYQRRKVGREFVTVPMIVAL